MFREPALPYTRAQESDRMINRTWGPLEKQLHERHDVNDSKIQTQDKLAVAS